MDRSQLFAPGHDASLLGTVFEAGADAVVLDLGTTVPADQKSTARAMVARALIVGNAGWVRINDARSEAARADLDALGGLPAGIRIPRAESPEAVRWVAERAPGVPLICAIETARGLLAAAEIARAPGVRMLALGVDLQRDLGASDGDLGLLYARSHLVACSSAADLDPPIDRLHPDPHDLVGLREEALQARSIGMFGKAASHPDQLPVIHEIFTPRGSELERAKEVVAAFDAAMGRPARLADAERVDRAAAERARRLLELADRVARQGQP